MQRNPLDKVNRTAIRSAEMALVSPGQPAFGPDTSQIGGFIAVDGTIIGCGMLGITPIGSFALCGRETS